MKRISIKERARRWVVVVRLAYREEPHTVNVAKEAWEAGYRAGKRTTQAQEWKR